MNGEMTRRSFVKTATAAGVVLLAGGTFGLAGCGEPPASLSGASGVSGTSGQSPASASSTSASGQVAGSATSDATSPAPADATAAVVFYSRAGENYNVGVVEVGNTAKVAQEIAAQTGAALLEVQPANAYPDAYDECCDVALAEQDDGARPALQQTPDLAAYDTIYLGYPIWWGDLPMAMYTLLEAVDLSGKAIHPFNTHEGSGNAGTYETIAGLCPDATVGEGLAIRGTVAQNEPEAVADAVRSWLAG